MFNTVPTVKEYLYPSTRDAGYELVFLSLYFPKLSHYICVLSWPIERCTLSWTVLWWHHCISISSETQNHSCLMLLQAVIANQRRKYVFVSAVIYFPRHLQKAPVQIAFLIRIKEEVSLLGWECKAFAASPVDAICAESSERLILATAATRFTDHCGDGFLVNTRFSPPKNNMLSWIQPWVINREVNCLSQQLKAEFSWACCLRRRETSLFPQTNCLEALSLPSCSVCVLPRPGGWKMSHN